jgi:hypothetical protein
MKFKKFGFLAIAIASILTSLTNSKKKKKNKKAEDPLNRRPIKIKPELYCDSCIAIIKEATKKLYNKKSESDVFEALEDICNQENYYTYRK